MTVLDRKFWRDKRVLVTGHTGFKGSWLCLLLDRLGAQVFGYALPPPTDPSLYALARVDTVVDSQIADIRNLTDFERRLTTTRPDIVIHMAAQSIVLNSYTDPLESYTTNVIGTATLFEALRRTGTRTTVINVTTDKCYENRGWVWGYRETDTLGGADPYSNSKACAELVAQCFRQSFFPIGEVARHGVAIASARAGNVVGGGDWTPRQLVPDAVAAFKSGKPVVLRHPDSVRPWQHVLDCLTGYLRLAEVLASDGAKGSGEWNFGPNPGDTLTVSQVVDVLAQHWSIQPAWAQDLQSHAHEAATLRLDVAKAAQLLGWRGKLTTRDALDWTAAWYRQLHDGNDARKITAAQIERFLAA